MMKRQISDILLVSDMDGTLIHSPEFPNDKDIAAINRFVDAGGHFTFATGRSITGADHYRKSIKINAPAAVFNGVVIYDYDNAKTVDDKTLPETAAEYLKDIMQKFPEVGIEVNKGLLSYSINYDSFLKMRAKNEGYEYIHKTVDEIQSGWYKVLFTPGSAVIQDLQEYIASKKWNDVACIATNADYFEMLPLNVSKGNALKKIASSLSIDIENTAAIGDYYNDIPMLEVAGITAAPSDALPEVKNMVDYVVENSRQGAVANFIDILFDLCDYH